MRLFVAAELPESVKAALAAAQERLRSGRPGSRAEGRANRSRGLRPIRWTRPEGLHVTLRFLGETDAAAVAGLREALARAAGRASPLSLRLGGLGCFPPSGPARVLWAGLEGDLDRLAALAAALESAAVSCGFPPERRPFRGHVTLARLEGGAEGAALRRRIAGPGEDGTTGGERFLEPPVPSVFPLTEVVLFESRLGSGGARYTALDRLALRGSG